MAAPQGARPALDRTGSYSAAFRSRLSGQVQTHDRSGRLNTGPGIGTGAGTGAPVPRGAAKCVRGSRGRTRFVFRLSTFFVLSFAIWVHSIHDRRRRFLLGRLRLSKGRTFVSV